MGDKRGISAIVATVLIILITVAAVTIVWSTVITLIGQDFGAENIGPTVEIVSSGGYTVYDPDEDDDGDSLEDDGVIMFQVHQGGSNTIQQVRLIWNVQGNSESIVVPAPGEKSTKLYGITGLSEKPDSISIVPLFIVDGDTKEGGISSTVTDVAEEDTIIYDNLQADYYLTDGSEDPDPPSGSCSPTGAEICTGGIDEDCNGFVDCADVAACSTDPACSSPTEICTNGIDDDTDSLIDCADPDCASDPMCELPTELTCNDGFDNDGDALVDCFDTADCSLDPACHVYFTQNFDSIGSYGSSSFPAVSGYTFSPNTLGDTLEFKELCVYVGPDATDAVVSLYHNDDGMGEWVRDGQAIFTSTSTPPISPGGWNCKVLSPFQKTYSNVTDISLILVAILGGPDHYQLYSHPSQVIGITDGVITLRGQQMDKLADGPSVTLPAASINYNLMQNELGTSSSFINGVPDIRYALV